MIWRLLPLAGVLLFIGVVCCWRPWLQRRRYGSTGVWLFRSGRWQQKVRDTLGVVLLVCLVGQAIVLAARPEGLSSLAVIEQLTATPWQLAGAVLLFGGIGLVVMAQLDLGASWRIGYALLLPTRLSLYCLGHSLGFGSRFWSRRATSCAVMETTIANTPAAWGAFCRGLGGSGDRGSGRLL